MSVFTLRFLALAVLMMFAQLACGQVQPRNASTPSKVPDRTKSEFSTWTPDALLNERDNLKKEIENLDNQIGWLDEAIRRRADRARLEADHIATKDIDLEIEKFLGNAGMNGTPLNELDKRFEQLKQVSEEKQSRKAGAEQELLRRADLEQPKQAFKLKMSIVFAALVGLVILGFFGMAYIDPQVRREIFAGQAGIQFVTLFSLVIAIILFGIIDILEGKELAALLGGLSGYILGRSTPTGGIGKRETGETAQAQPVVQAEPAVEAEPAVQADPLGRPTPVSSR